jgi:hypothetical protein
VEAAVDRGAFRSTLNAILATGASRWEAFGLATQALGEAAARPHWDRWAQGIQRSDTIVRALAEVGRVVPETANAWFNAWLAAWLKVNVRILGDLDLSGQAWLRSLPKHLWTREPADDLKQSGSLDLSLTGIVSLPEDLRVEGDLFMAGCPHWDGRIPKGVESLEVVTDAHPQGAYLKDWRKLHPEGERA